MDFRQRLQKATERGQRTRDEKARKERAAEILGRTEKDLKKIKSEAYRESEEIKGEADAEAAAIYAQAYKKDPELYNFLKTLESYEQTVTENTWLLLSTDTDYARHLRTMERKGR